MDGDADLVGGQIEEAAGFDDLEALVHHGGGVDGDALAHDPGGMLEGLGGGDVGEVGGGGVAEGATGGGEPDLFHLGGRAAAHGLVDGVVLAVDGQEGYVVGAGGGDDEVAGGDEAFLVGEADGLAGEDGGVGGFEAGDADDGGDDEVDVGVRGDGDGAGGAVEDFDAGDAGFAEAELEGFGEGLGGERDESGAPALGLFEGDFKVGAGGEGDGGVAVWETAGRWRGCSGRWSRWSPGLRVSSLDSFSQIAARLGPLAGSGPTGTRERRGAG